MSLKKIISGGQTGGDRGGLDAAIDAGLSHGGFCPKGRRAEDGVIPAKYELTETASSDYTDRTKRNIIVSTGTAIFVYGEPTGGSKMTKAFAESQYRPNCVIDLSVVSDDEAAGLLGAFVRKHAIECLNVAGSRESKAPGIQLRTKNVVAGMLHFDKEKT